MIDRVQRDDYRIVIIPDKIKDKISSEMDFSGKPIRDLDRYQNEWNASFEFKFVEYGKLKKAEKQVFDQTKRIIELIGGLPGNVNDIRISETMRIDSKTSFETEGLWSPNDGSITIKRDQLKKLDLYAGVLLHEIAHAESGASDVSIDFENKLTEYLGKTASENLKI